MTLKEQALKLVREYGWHIVRCNITHNETACDGGEANCKSVSFPDKSRAETASNDPDVIESWDWDSVNAYAIDCGLSGILAADRDPHATWPFNGTRVHSSGRGEHYIYEDLIGFGNRTNVKPWGIDVRSDGGILFGPGSWHPHGEYAVLEDVAPAAVPAELREALAKPELRVDAEVSPLDQLEALDRLQGVYRRMSKTGPGQRNDMLNKLAGTAAGLWVRIPEDQRTGELHEDIIKQHLFDAVQDMDDRAGFQATLASGWSHGLENPTPDPIALQNEIFATTPTLNHIRTAAHSAGRSGMGVLCAVLARVMAEVGPEYLLPGAQDGVIGGRAALNLGFAFVGGPGSGKSDAMSLSEDILGVDQSAIQKTPSSGEGLIQSYLRWDQSTKTNVLRDDPRCIFNVDEIGTLGAVGARNGATIASRIRTMITGTQEGTANGTHELIRNLPKHSYRFVLVAGVQPALSGVLLKDSDAGMPQRFVWVRAYGEDVPEPDERPEWPGALEWTLPPLEFESTVIDYPQWIKDEVRRVDYERNKTGDPTNAHINLTRLKLSAALAFLHGETKISDRWWSIAGLICELSLREQAACRNALSAATDEEDVRRGQREARIEQVIEDTKTQRVATRIVRVLQRYGDEDGMKRSDVRVRVGQPLRPFIDEAIEQLVEEGLIGVVGTKDGRPGRRFVLRGGV